MSLLKQIIKYNLTLFFCLSLLAISGCSNNPEFNYIQNENNKSIVEEMPVSEHGVPELILLGARNEVKNKVWYDAGYYSISYPDGDVLSDRGACTDVIVRAFRNANIDLQFLIHEDMNQNFNLYPQNWGLTRTDPNIDHRRIPNQMNFFERHGTSLTLDTGSASLAEWLWGDIVYWRFDDGMEHCGIISDKKTRNGIPLVIHNASIAREEDCLSRWEIIGHFRFNLE